MGTSRHFAAMGMVADPSMGKDIEHVASIDFV
jgi:hypothetical protein